MAKIILHFPHRAQLALSCVWVETGNPAQPLACRWIARIPTSIGTTALEGDRSFGHILCA